MMCHVAFALLCRVDDVEVVLVGCRVATVEVLETSLNRVFLDRDCVLEGV